MQKPLARLFFVVSGVIAIGLAACGTQGGPSPLVPANAVAPAANAAGANGVTIESPSLGKSTRISTSYDPRGTIAAPSSWSIVPGTLHISFSPALKPTRTSELGLRITLAYPASRATQIQAGHALRIVIAFANGTHLPLVIRGRLDAKENRIVADLPASLIGGAAGMSVALGTDNIKYAMEPPGPRYWDGKKWNATGTIVPNKKTVILVHGIFSSVESAFPTPAPKSTEVPCPQRIAAAGGFEQVLGFDYKWNEPPYYGGDRFADFLKQIADAGVKSVAIEAHSYGTVVTLAAIPLVEDKIKVSDAVLLGGPLPLRGTPLAKKENHWRMGMILGLMDWYSDESPKVVDRAFDSGMVASLAPNSDDLTSIRDAVGLMSKKPNFVQVAGTEWICFVSAFGACVYSEKKFEKQLVDGSGVQLPWDGVVEKIAANSTDIPNPTATALPVSHIELECHNDVIKWVGKQINPGSRH